MNKTHKIKLYPTRAQERLLVKSCGVARFAYNWALDQWNKKREAGERTSAYSLIKELTAIKREQFPWMMEVSKTCPQYAIHNLESAFKAFFKKQSKYPKFKKKGQRDSFLAIENKEAFNQKNYRIHIPRIGKVKCAENLRFEGKINNVTVIRTADLWFACVNIETNEIPAVCENQATVGIDLGVKSLMVLSDGTVIENPKALRTNLRSLKRLQRRFSRKQKGGKNMLKAKVKLARKHYRISCIRQNAIHQATAAIVKNYGKVVIETLNPKGMMQNRRLALSIADSSFGIIKRVLEYKCKNAGVELAFADRFFPSSKTCSNCGNIKQDLTLSDRIYSCSCDFSIDRDLNAAINLSKYKTTQKSWGSNACGDRSSPIISDSLSMNQELNIHVCSKT